MSSAPSLSWVSVAGDQLGVPEASAFGRLLIVFERGGPKLRRMALYRDRRDAGERLADELEDLRGRPDLLVRALPWKRLAGRTRAAVPMERKRVRRDLPGSYESLFHRVWVPRFDLVIHLDVTQAVEPLERMPLWEAGEPAETYPTGL